MGEVYEAVDLELDDHVALKGLACERMQDERALERFRREIHLARKVTHQNVCRIYDLFHHRETNRRRLIARHPCVEHGTAFRADTL